tara:strand:- start:4263 stop:5678 length:1416 start_codon:yes stop_codon:yes gene_type:complete
MIGLSGSIQFVTSSMERFSVRAHASVNKILSSGDPVRRARHENDAGAISLAAKLSFDSAAKRNSISSFQNAISFMQLQESALNQADRIYQEMISLASLASDPSANQENRHLLGQQFESLRQQSLDLNQSTFNDRYLFDELAASTDYTVDFASGLTNDTPATISGSPKVWEVTKDVLYNTGKMTIDVNSGTAGDRYMLKQDNLVIFDSGSWDTAGNAKTYDYDRFEIEYGPDKETTFKFIAQSDGNSSSVDLDGPDGIKGTADDGVLPSDNTFDNKPYYLNNLGLTDDGTSSGVANSSEVLYTNQGQVTTAKSNPDTTNLTLRIESNTLFQIGAEFTKPNADDILVGNASDIQVAMKPLGLGLLLSQEAGNPPLSIATASEAVKALQSITKEIEGVAEQLGTLRSNFTKVELAMEGVQKKLASQENVMSIISDEGLAEDLTQLSRDRILRSQSAAIMTQAISVNEGIVDLIL